MSDDWCMMIKMIIKCWWFDDDGWCSILSQSGDLFTNPPTISVSSIGFSTKLDGHTWRTYGPRWTDGPIDGHTASLKRLIEIGHHFGKNAHFFQNKSFYVCQNAAVGCKFVQSATKIKTVAKCPKHEGHIVELQVSILSWRKETRQLLKLASTLEKRCS